MRLEQIVTRLTQPRTKMCGAACLPIAYEDADAAELSSLLKVMVMLADAPAYLLSWLKPEHVEICERGRRLRRQLPLYLEAQRAGVLASCPLPAVLQSIVTEPSMLRRYHVPEDMWTDGLLIQAP
jgi:hypothetical protein